MVAYLWLESFDYVGLLCNLGFSRKRGCGEKRWKVREERGKSSFDSI